MRQSNLWKRLVALTATCTLIAGVFTGCGNDTPANKPKVDINPPIIKLLLSKFPNPVKTKKNPITSANILIKNNLSTLCGTFS